METRLSPSILVFCNSNWESVLSLSELGNVARTPTTPFPNLFTLWVIKDHHSESLTPLLPSPP